MLFKYTAKNIPLQYRKFNLIIENNKNYHFANKFFTFSENYNLKKKKENEESSSRDCDDDDDSPSVYHE